MEDNSQSPEGEQDKDEREFDLFPSKIRFNFAIRLISDPTRKTFTIRRKRETLMRLAKAKADNTFISLRNFAASEHIQPTTLHNWIKDAPKWEKAVSDKSVVIGKVRKLGSGRRAKFASLETKLMSWVKDRNDRGLRIKDKFIKIHAKTLRTQILSELGAVGDDDALDEVVKYKKELTTFAVSDHWVQTFKKRHKLAARRQTSSRMLPEGYQSMRRCSRKVIVGRLKQT